MLSRLPGWRIVAAAGAMMAGSVADSLANEPCALPIAGEAEEAQAVRAMSGDTIELSDGRQVRLAGIVAPGTGLSEEPQPAIEAARRAMHALVAGKHISLRVLAASDRYGRVVAAVSMTGGAASSSLHAALLAGGNARLLPQADGCAPGLQASERAARDARLGLWSDPHYSVLDAGKSAGFSGRAGDMVLAEGRVASVNLSGSRLYLNFAERWQDGLSVTIWKGDFAKFPGGESALRAMQGSQIRVRGWLTGESSGPLMAVSGPAQIEWVGTERAAEGE